MTAMDKPIKTYALSELPSLMKELAQPSFRAQQLTEWLYQRHVSSYDEMTNLPAALRAVLSERFPLTMPEIVNRQVSRDGTRKYLIEFDDGIRVETVAIPSRGGDRLTVCFSTQAGCAIGCAFCATGREGFARNLTPGEIIDQVLIAQDDMGKRVTNVVGMGQGEPFLNYGNTMAALRILNNKKGLEIGARHISVSTCGILPGIERFSEEPEQFTLAVSLHAARQGVRDLLMPNVARFKLGNLKSALQEYIAKTNRRVTLEYIMIDGVNDADEDLKALQKFCANLLCHVNLIPINAIEGSVFQPSEPETIDRWLNAIQKKGTEATLRDSRGSDIDGACGQLKNTFK
ncbi:23S rRNA (adenine(2503)-C(2))-methyltransferase RlmN [Eggerthella sinensis]|uniref:Probable dual-specificity RNA methyltransferase RlmN n=2 Tax=Eggerthella sinensis TaxID=242230 RepID=A0A3N0IYZ8_9ACTN|nr:23S rRNA (adenine(2503)-C(2))-methyltransferase RlmN [Eggerthella sinensis]RNM42209.1 23S rRNA (adenine(2503)-C(2))-methyltransferase RlmN [Eggerthella sinensis]